MKYERGMKRTRVGAQILSIEQYNCDAAKLEAAINRAQPKTAEQQNKIEQRGKIFKLGGTLSPIGAERVGELRRTDAKGKYTLRVSIGSENTLAALVLATDWDIQVATQEGQDGGTFQNPPNQATFTVPRIRVPVKGLCVDLDGDYQQAQIFNQTTNALIYDIAGAIAEGRSQEDTQPFENNSGGDAPIFEFSHHYEVAVPGGVVLGDTIETRSYAGVLLATYPAREGGFWPVLLRAAVVRYVPIGPVVSNLLWTFHRRI